jgi:hypothetical protein
MRRFSDRRLPAGYYTLAEKGAIFAWFCIDIIASKLRDWILGFFFV